MNSSTVLDALSAKPCSMCGVEKPLSEFVPDRRKTAGVTSNCRECRNRRGRELRAEHPERYASYKMSAEYQREYSRRWYQKNKERLRPIREKWRRENRERTNAYMRERRRKNAQHKVVSNLRGRLNDALKRGTASKAAPITELIGCTIPELKAHLEAQFEPGMSWENYGKGAGKWHIDHIRPCASFDLTDEGQQRECFHYTNMQPLWEEENLSKGAKIIE